MPHIIKETTFFKFFVRILWVNPIYKFLLFNIPNRLLGNTLCGLFAYNQIISGWEWNDRLVDWLVYSFLLTRFYFFCFWKGRARVYGEAFKTKVILQFSNVSCLLITGNGRIMMTKVQLHSLNVIYDVETIWFFFWFFLNLFIYFLLICN